MLYIEKDADVNAVENTVELLIQKGADVNAVGANGRTALIWAAKMGTSE